MVVDTEGNSAINLCLFTVKVDCNMNCMISYMCLLSTVASNTQFMCTESNSLIVIVAIKVKLLVKRLLDPHVINDLMTFW